VAGTLEGVRPAGSGGGKVAFCLYGPPGIGKTRMIGTGPRTLIVRPPTDHTESIRGGDAQEKVVNDWDDLNNVYEYLRHGGAEDWDWVWLDSISLFQDHGLDDIWESVVAEKPHRAKHGVDKGEYGVNMHRLGLWVRHMVGLPGFNFGVTAHPAELANPEDELILMPYVQGRNMSNKVCGYMNIVAYLEIKQGKRVLRTAATERYYAKDQFDAFENARMVEPTMPKIIAAIDKARGDKGSKPTPAKRRTSRRKATSRR
jgi:hypothetical protein